MTRCSHESAAALFRPRRTLWNWLVNRGGWKLGMSRTVECYGAQCVTCSDVLEFVKPFRSVFVADVCDELLEWKALS